jgi:hypothetical protein
MSLRFKKPTEKIRVPALDQGLDTRRNRLVLKGNNPAAREDRSSNSLAEFASKLGKDKKHKKDKKRKKKEKKSKKNKRSKRVSFDSDGETEGLDEFSDEGSVGFESGSEDFEEPAAPPPSRSFSASRPPAPASGNRGNRLAPRGTPSFDDGSVDGASFTGSEGSFGSRSTQSDTMLSFISTGSDASAPKKSSVPIKSPLFSNMSSKEAENAEKSDILARFHFFKQKGVQLSRNYTMRDSLHDLRLEIGRLEYEEQTQRAIKYQRRTFLAGASLLTTATNKYAPKRFKGKWDGFDSFMLSRLDEYDHAFERMNEEYGGTIGAITNGNPLLEVFTLFVYQFVMYGLFHKASEEGETVGKLAEEDIKNKYPHVLKAAVDSELAAIREKELKEIREKQMEQQQQQQRFMQEQNDRMRNLMSGIGGGVPNFQPMHHQFSPPHTYGNGPSGPSQQHAPQFGQAMPWSAPQSQPQHAQPHQQESQRPPKPANTFALPMPSHIQGHPPPQKANINRETPFTPTPTKTSEPEPNFMVRPGRETTTYVNRVPSVDVETGNPHTEGVSDGAFDSFDAMKGALPQIDGRFEAMNDAPAPQIVQLDDVAQTFGHDSFNGTENGVADDAYDIPPSTRDGYRNKSRVVNGEVVEEAAVGGDDDGAEGELDI